MIRLDLTYFIVNYNVYNIWIGQQIIPTYKGPLHDGYKP